MANLVSLSTLPSSGPYPFISSLLDLYLELVDRRLIRNHIPLDGVDLFLAELNNILAVLLHATEFLTYHDEGCHHTFVSTRCQCLFTVV